MAGARYGRRLIALLAGLGMCLGGAALFARSADDDDLVGNKASKTYHRADCEIAKTITAKNKVEVMSSDEARVLQLKPCTVCKPPVSGQPKGDADKTDGDMPSKGKA